MHLPRRFTFPFVCAASLGALALALVSACAESSNDAVDGVVVDAGGGVDRDATGCGGGSRDGGAPTPDGAVSEPDADAPDAAVICSDASVPPVEDGGLPCGAIDFGAPAAPFGGVDAGDTGPYRGGTLLPGIYDAVLAERASGAGGSFRETLVILPGNRFTRTRQLDTGTGPGPLSHRSGTFEVTGDNVKFTYACSVNDGTPITSNPDTFPFEVVGDACGKLVYRFGLSSLRFTLERR